MCVNPNGSECVNFALCEPTRVPLMGGGPYDPVKGGSVKRGLTESTLKRDPLTRGSKKVGPLI